MKSYRQDGSEKIIYWILGGFTLVILFLIGSVARGEQVEATKQGRVTKYKAADTDRPAVTIGGNEQDLGVMNVSDDKSADFSVKNTGTYDLSLYNISSSCGCTGGVVTIGGVKSPEGAMHTKSSWIGTVKPGGTATVTVIYRPSVMPVKGPVSRAVTIDTNDPDNPKITFTVKATVI